MVVQIAEPPHTLQVNRNNGESLVLGDIIGQGAFGVVRLAKHHVAMEPTHHTESSDPTHDEYLAVKCIEKTVSPEQYQLVKDEIAILSKCAGIAFVAQLRFVIETRKMHFVALEFCSGGDLFTLLSTHGVSRDQGLSFIAQIASGLAQIHRQQIVYHDLKLENICLDEAGNARLIDFGLATVLDESTYNPNTHRHEVVTAGGTLDYSAPEIFHRYAHAYEADWWSFGVLAYELLCGDLPFYLEDASDTEQCEYICSSAGFHRNDIIAEGSDEESFVEMFLQKDQKARFGYDVIDMKRIKNHPLFQDTEFF